MQNSNAGAGWNAPAKNRFRRFSYFSSVLKAHSLAGVTPTMKNMMGLPPPAHYQQGGYWKKASFDETIQKVFLT